MHSTSSGSLQQTVSYCNATICLRLLGLTFTPGLPVTVPLRFIMAPLTLSPIVGLRFCTLVAPVVVPVVRWLVVCLELVPTLLVPAVVPV